MKGGVDVGGLGSGAGGAGQRLGVWCHLRLSKERSSQVVRDFNDRERRRKAHPPPSPPLFPVTQCSGRG